MVPVCVPCAFGTLMRPRHGDVFFRFFDGGFLRFTEFEDWEDRLMKLAGKKLIVSPYGADGFIAPMVVDGAVNGAVNGAVFVAYVAVR